MPAALLDAGLAGDRQVVVLEPRRIAARAAAEFVAARARRHGRRRGRLPRPLRAARRRRRPGCGSSPRASSAAGWRDDPFLEDVGVVVLDEFHERHLQGDVALAVVRELQDTVRPDLKLVVMSATLETEALAAHLAGRPVLTSEGRAYPVRDRATARR